MPKPTLSASFDNGVAMSLPDSTSPAERSSVASDPERLLVALVRTVTYANLFDYPLTVAEAHRYLEVPATPAQIAALIGNGSWPRDRLSYREGFFTLAGREHIIAVRRQREAHARLLWPRALTYARLLASVPFVRMVALTGSLAVNNPDERSDFDYFIVTAADRLWLCRAFIVAIVRWIARRGDVICPNYLLSERTLALEPRNLFVARELAQMVPLYGWDIYRRLREVNAWSRALLPNADGPPPCPVYPDSADIPAFSRWGRGVAEVVLRLPPVGRLERWEMRRKVRKLQRLYPDQSEAIFSVNCCKGHFDGHARRIISLYNENLRSLDMYKEVE
jgi:hypothetical protein